jgi:peptidoglycan/xylan/chitin deacetylase (PgdA/CDA1 family)/O-antigen/teichoic acid export membrane protein
MQLLRKYQAAACFWASKGSATLVDQFLISGSNFLLTLTLAKLLGPIHYGAYVVMFSIFLLLGNVHQALLLEPMGVFQPSDYPDRRRRYVGSVLFMHIAVSAAFALLTLAAALVIWALGHHELARTACGVAFAIPTILFLWTARAASYLDFRPSRAAVASFLYCVILLGLLVLVYRNSLLSGFTTFVMMGTAGTVAGGVLMWHLRPQFGSEAGPSVSDLWRKHWDYGRWSLLGVTVMWLEVNSAFLWIGSFLGFAEAGGLAALQALNLPVNHVLQGSSRLLLPYLSKLSGERGPAAARGVTLQLSGLFLMATGVYWALCSLFNKEILNLLYGPKYLPFAHYVAPAMVCLVVSAGIVPQEIGLRALKAPKQLLRAAMITSTCSVVSAILLIRWLGLPGVFITTAATSLVHFSMVSFLLRREARRAPGSPDDVAPAPQRGADSLPVLVYHHVGPARPGVYRTLTISPRRFKAHMAWLARLGFQTVSQGHVLQWLRGERTLPPKPVMITFDDAYEDLCDYAFPEVQKRGFNAVTFVVTGHVGQSNLFDQRNGCGPLNLMSIEQIRDWQAKGLEFGAHSRSHPKLAAVSPETLAEEIAGSREDLEFILNRPALSFAYPHGSYNREVEDQAAASFDLVFTTECGLNNGETLAHRIRRTVTHHRDTSLDILLRASLGWSPIEVMREMVLVRLRPLLAGFRTPEIRSNHENA